MPKGCRWAGKKIKISSDMSLEEPAKGIRLASRPNYLVSNYLVVTPGIDRGRRRVVN